MFSTSDIGWVVGHSYIIYGPLLAGTDDHVRGHARAPTPASGGRSSRTYKVKVMFSSRPPRSACSRSRTRPSLKKHDDLSSLKTCSSPASRSSRPATSGSWKSSASRSSTTTGRPRPAGRCSPSAAAWKTAKRSRLARLPGRWLHLRIFREDGTECGANEKGIVGIVPPLPPGCLSTVWGQDDRFVSTYFSLFTEPVVYSSSDWGIKDDKGYYTILGRMDDVINVAGHRLGTARSRRRCRPAAIAEVAVVGAADELKARCRWPSRWSRTPPIVDIAEKRCRAREGGHEEGGREPGCDRPPARCTSSAACPRRVPGKMLRRSIQALAEGRDAGDLTTIDDPSTLEQIKAALKS